ncbi:hypothetical protein B0H15DRAFT_957720 [Mycena belliarum]|uniref:Uncharacterized protein n=1 Tax=Mycena belliarum TaxID=1033014 RepID=A0AAD6TPE7_9AGAR|nr:hypothetical protein B0H15DRAFT_957720 [Mycena belliae]
MADDLESDAFLLHRIAFDDAGNTIFDPYVEALNAMGTANLAANDFGKTFERVKDEKGRLVYITKPGGADFTANIIAEVGSEQQGTWLRAYPPRNPPSLPFGDDSAIHRMVIGARCPTGATPEMSTMYNDFLAALDGTRDIDQAEEEEKKRITEWTTRADGRKDLPADCMLLRLKPTYEKPFGNRSLSPPRSVRNSKSDAGATTTKVGEDVDMAGGDKADAAILARKVGDTYPPALLSDHKGPYFAHEKAKLLYAALTEGTLFSAQISLSTYVMKDKNPKFMDSKIYHINVDKLTILDKGNGPVWNPPVPALPGTVQSAPATPKGKRVRDPTVDSAFDNLSPSKKSRTA